MRFLQRCRHLLLDCWHSLLHEAILVGSFQSNVNVSVWVNGIINITWALLQEKPHRLVFTIEEVGHVKILLSQLCPTKALIELNCHLRNFSFQWLPSFLIKLKYGVDLKLFIKCCCICLLAQDLDLCLSLLLATRPDDTNWCTLSNFQLELLDMDVDAELLLMSQFGLFSWIYLVHI